MALDGGRLLIRGVTEYEAVEEQRGTVYVNY